MLLPNHAEAIIAIEKIRDFLLDLDHETGGGKANLLYSMGFVRERWQELEAAIRELIATNDAVQSARPGSTKFLVRGRLHGPTASQMFLTVWMVDEGTSAPRLITAYPRSRP